jgi:hypothetical protein
MVQVGVVIAYASRTGTRRNLAEIRRAGWRILVSAKGVLRNEGFPWALDNGAWTAFQRREPFDVPAFDRAVSLMGVGADWIVVPDKVADASESLRMTREWLPRLMGVAPLLVAVQDGMTVDHVRDMLGPKCGIFLGGGTEWKLATMSYWGEHCSRIGCHYHVARVNTVGRIRAAHLARAHSIDGTSASRFAMSTPKLSRAVSQPPLPNVF